ncbi:MAG TPA: type II CAAX endopeptidase family protein [Capsulimonadaceae bacterium]|jgi:membrane protease YdiL (CAAX protease family)
MSTETPSHDQITIRQRLAALFPQPAPDGPTDNRTAAITFVVGGIVSAFLFYANGRMYPFEEYQIVNVAALFWLPIVAVMLFCKQTPSEFGLRAGDRKLGWMWVAIGYLAMLPAVLVVAHNPEFTQYYVRRMTQPLAVTNWAPFPYTGHPTVVSVAYYEIVMGVYFFCWEFFFRGFMLFGLARGSKIGVWGAIILQTIPFTLLHWSLAPGAAKPGLETFGAALGGPALGYLAFRTRTFFYGFLIHWLMASTLDLLVVWPHLAAIR